MPEVPMDCDEVMLLWEGRGLRKEIIQGEEMEARE